MEQDAEFIRRNKKTPWGDIIIYRGRIHSAFLKLKLNSKLKSKLNSKLNSKLKSKSKLKSRLKMEQEADFELEFELELENGTRRRIHSAA